MEDYIRKICPFCMTEIKEGEPVKICPSCSIPHHETCWKENKGCTTFGCSEQHYEPQGTNPTDVCSKCGAVLGDGQEFCPKCGTPKNAQKANICEKCGTELAEGQAFCSKCGQKVGMTVEAGVSSAINQFNIEVNKKNKKKIIVPVVVGAIAVIGLAVFLLLKGPAVEEIVLSKTSLELKVDDSQSVPFTISPDKASGAEVTWESSNESVATVTSNGMIIGKSDGSCTITVYAGGKADSLAVTVKTGPDFNAIYQTMGCEQPWAEVGLDNSYLKLDTNPYDTEDAALSYSEAYITALAVNSVLGLPDSLANAFGEVTGADGRQTKDYPNQGVSVSYKYHPDNGLEITYEVLN